MLIFTQIKEAASHIGGADIEREKRYFEEMTQVDKNDPTGQIFRHFDVLSGRTGSLLSHISIMIAVTAFMFSISYPAGTKLDVFGILLAVELTLYSALTIPVLSMTFVTNSLTSSRHKPNFDQTDPKTVLDAYLRVFHARRAYFYFSFIVLNCLNLVFVLTIASKFAFRYFV